MARLSEIAINKERESEGVWHPWILDLRIRVARLGNPAMQAWLRERHAQRSVEQRPEDMPADTLAEVSKAGIAQHVLKDISGLEDDDGKPLVYTPELGLKLFNLEGVDLYGTVVLLASQDDHYRNLRKEQSLGN